MDDAAAEDPRPSGSVLGTVIGVAVFLVVVGVFLSTYDALAIGDGAVAVTSESLQVETVQAADGTSMTLVGHAPGGTMSIGVPIYNRGFVPVAITGIEAVDGAGEDPASTGSGNPCEWQVTGVGTTREESQVPRGGSFPAVRIAGRATVQLYLGAALPEGECLAGDREQVRDTLALSYRVLGPVSQRQEIPMTPTAVADADDPRFEQP